MFILKHHGGWSIFEVYNLPTQLRRWFVKRLIKEFEDETNLRCNMIVDGSGSMRYGESTISKFDYARQLAASLGFLLLGPPIIFVGLAVFVIGAVKGSSKSE